MSFYNMLFGKCPFSDLLLEILGLTEGDCGRFRDCYINKEGEIRIYTRNGGGNRETYQGIIDVLAKHPNYLRDADDDFDSTYCYIDFSVPEASKGIIDILRAGSETINPKEKFQKLFDDLQKQNETPEVKRALGVGKQILSALNRGDEAGQPKVP